MDTIDAIGRAREEIGRTPSLATESKAIARLGLDLLKAYIEIKRIIEMVEDRLDDTPFITEIRASERRLLDTISAAVAAIRDQNERRPN